MATGVMIESKNLQTALDAGAIDFIRKPFDKIEFNVLVSVRSLAIQKWECPNSSSERRSPSIIGLLLKLLRGIVAS